MVLMSSHKMNHNSSLLFGPLDHLLPGNGPLEQSSAFRERNKLTE